MEKLLFVTAGGAIGTAARYLLVLGTTRWVGSAFPYGTLAVNIIGSFLLAFMAHMFLVTTAVSPNLRLLLTTGFTGGFTTYSAFNTEVLHLMHEGEWTRALTYLLFTLLGCAVAGVSGFASARWLVAG